MDQSLQMLVATQADYDELAEIGRLAFEADKRMFGAGPDIYENPGFLLPLLAAGDGGVRKLCLGGRAVGLIVTFEKTAASRWLGCICLLPEWQGWGYGSRALELLEAAYPDVTQWGLDTPAAKTLNLRFYGKAGYKVIGESTTPDGMKLAVLEKRR
jgi:GNAT superfamily N-acetyltransferase